MFLLLSLLAAQSALAGSSGTPLFLWSNGKSFPTPRVSQTVDTSDAKCLVAHLGYAGATCEIASNIFAEIPSSKSAQLLASFRVPGLSTFDAAHSELLQEISSESDGNSMFLPFVSKELETKNLGKNVLRVTDFEEFEVAFAQTQKNFDFVEFLTPDQTHAEHEMKLLREWALNHPDLDVVAFMGAAPKGFVSGVYGIPEAKRSTRRRRLGEDDGENDGEDEDEYEYEASTYYIMCTSNILCGLLVSFMLFIIGYCGLQNLMNVETPLRTPNLNLVIRKEF